MKRIVSLLTAVIVAATIISLPVCGKVYAETDNENLTPVITQEVESQTDSSNVDHVEKIDIDSEAVEIAVGAKEYLYTGDAVTPEPVLSYNGETLVKGTDYTLTYIDNVNAGTGLITVTAIGEKYTGVKTFEFKIVAKNIEKAGISLPYSNYAYRNKNIEPKPTVKLNGEKLVKDRDYTVSYIDNYYPGIATVVITGIGNYKGSVEKEFYIAKMSALTLKDRGFSALKVGWSKRINVTGYQIYRFDTERNKWVWAKTIKGANNTSTIVKGLKDGRGHKLKIRAYVKDSEGKAHYGNFSKVVSIATKPGKVIISSLSTNVKMQLKLKWKKKTGNGYQIAVSTNSKFKNAATYTIKSSNTLSKNIQVKKNNKNYYVKVRAYKIVSGEKIYGSWSNVKKIKTDGTGWGTFSGRKYYYRNGAPLKGQHTISGNPYYFGPNTGVLVGVNKKMYDMTKKEKSGTKYLVSVDRRENRVCIYHKDDGEWVVKYYWKCSTGAPSDYSKISCTPSGAYTVPKTRTHMKYFGDNEGYRCWYTTRVKKSYLFHSIKYYPGSKTRVMDGRLGYNISHGCIRMDIDNAYWMYKNIHAGTKVVIY